MNYAEIIVKVINELAEEFKISNDEAKDRLGRYISTAHYDYLVNVSNYTEK